MILLLVATSDMIASRSGVRGRVPSHSVRRW